MHKTPVILVVLDGWGVREETEHNPIAQANTPVFDSLVEQFPYTQLEASGEAVGLPAGQMGNSEVGHTTIGAGKVVYQDLVRLSKEAQRGGFSENTVLTHAYHHVCTRKSTLHILGLLSSGGVHAHEDHFIELVLAAKRAGVARIVLHPFLDGRDAPKTSGLISMRKLETLVAAVEGCVIGSVSGRYYAMDRDTNWERTNAAFQAIFNGKADRVYAETVLPSQIIQERYHEEVFDEHMEPMVFQSSAGQVYEVRDGDALVFANFRSDRAKQLAQKITEFSEDKDLCVVSMTSYGKEIHTLVAYTPDEITETLGSALAAAGRTQVHIAETEKYPHATYFLNGGRQEPYDGEKDILIPSRKDIHTHDEAPEMRAKEICDAALEHLDQCDFMFINFANPDMVGHTANEAAIITAIETVDVQLGRLTQRLIEIGGSALIIADHGNAETAIDPTTGEPHTSHTINPVPCVFISPQGNSYQLRAGTLADVAPTILDALDVPVPSSMTGQSLLLREGSL